MANLLRGTPPAKRQATGESEAPVAVTNNDAPVPYVLPAPLQRPPAADRGTATRKRTATVETADNTASTSTTKRTRSTSSTRAEPVTSRQPAELEPEPEPELEPEQPEPVGPNQSVPGDIAQVLEIETWPYIWVSSKSGSETVVLTVRCSFR